LVAVAAKFPACGAIWLGGMSNLVEIVAIAFGVRENFNLMIVMRFRLVVLAVVARLSVGV
jgi:putative copper export protein